MSRIHYFQRYSSQENVVTNNTLQLFARIYDYSPSKASQLLSVLTGEQVDIGIEIHQQTKGNTSVPDGAIIQRKFEILIESKVDSPTNVDQLLRHSDSFSGKDYGSQRILLLLTREPIGADERAFQSHISKRNPGVLFKNVTYEAICNGIDGLFQEYEYEMCALVDDYGEYCNDVGLFDQSRHLMRVVPCGRSLEINKKYGIYFQPSDRGYTRHQYVGIYKDKSVQVLWEIDSVFDVDHDEGNPADGKLKKVLVQGRETNEYDDKLLAIIEDARAECGYYIATGHRFFCGKPMETDYRKSTPGGIQGARFRNLREVIESSSGATELADRLRGKEWA